MRRKIFENKIVRKSIVWAMTFMMAFSSVGGSMTVFAEESSAVDEFTNSGYESEAAKSVEEKSDEAHEAAGEAADAAADAAEAATDAEAAADAVADLKDVALNLNNELGVDVIKAVEGEDGTVSYEVIDTEENKSDSVADLVDLAENATNEALNEFYTDKETSEAKHVKENDEQMTVAEVATEMNTKLDEVIKVGGSLVEDSAIRDIKNETKIIQQDLEDVLAADFDSEKGNQEAAQAVADAAKKNYDNAKKLANEAAADVKTAEEAYAVAKADYDDLVALNDGIDAAVANAQEKVAAAQAALDAAKATYDAAMENKRTAQEAAADAATAALEAAAQAEEVENKLAEITNDGKKYQELKDAVEDASERKSDVDKAQDEIINTQKEIVESAQTTMTSLQANYEEANKILNSEKHNGKYVKEKNWSWKKLKYVYDYYFEDEVNTARTNKEKYETAQAEKVAAENAIAVANLEKANAANALTEAETSLAMVQNYIFDKDKYTIGYDLASDEEYNKLLDELNSSTNSANVVADDTLNYIAVTDMNWYEKDFEDLGTELRIEAKYHAWFSEKEDEEKRDGTYFFIGLDKRNQRYLICLTNKKIVARELDEVEADTYAASFNSYAAAQASVAANESALKETDALAAYNEALEALTQAQAELDALKNQKTKADLDAAEAVVADAENKLTKANAEADAAKNVLDWANALANTQKTRIYARVVDGELVFVNDFDTSDSSVVSQSVKKFQEVTTGVGQGVEVPYEVMHAYLAQQYEVAQKQYAKIKNGNGISIGQILTETIELEDGTTVQKITTDDVGTMNQLFWILDDSNKLQKDAKPMTLAEMIETAKAEALAAKEAAEEAGEDVSEEFTYEYTALLGYTFKHEGDGYHIDGVLYKFVITIPKEEDEEPEIIVTPTGGGTTTGGGAGGGGRAAGAAGDVLGAKREDLAIVSEQGDVLGATRAPKTSDSAKAILWMLVMGSSAIGAAAVLASKKKEA